MAKTRPRKRRLVKKYAAKTADSPPKVEKKPTKKKMKKKKAKITKLGSPQSDSETDPQTQIQTLLEPFSKDQLVTLVTDLSLTSASLFSLIKSSADEDVSHRKIFIHSLGWDATRELVESVFGAYGEIEDLNVVNDRATGKCKGYAFITFRTRKSTRKLLKNPKVQVGNRVASCQLASEGPSAPTLPTAPGVVSQQHFPTSDYPQRKIYVNNVPVNANADRLRAFFEQFGEIENGPKGFDPTTGRFKGYAIFVYKTVEGAKKVLEDPHKVFDGCQLECRKAAEGKGKLAGGSASITTALQPVQPQMLAAVAVAQQAQAHSMPFLGHQMGLVNPLYGGGMISGADMSGLMGGYYGIMGGQVQGLGLGSYGVAGSYGVSGGAEGGVSGSMLQNMQYMYPSGRGGQTSSYLAKVPKSNEGYSPICCRRT